jgi:hypothetical protein
MESGKPDSHPGLSHSTQRMVTINLPENKLGGSTLRTSTILHCGPTTHPEIHTQMVTNRKESTSRERSKHKSLSIMQQRD